MTRSEALEYLKNDGTSLEKHVVLALARHGAGFLTDDQLALLASEHTYRIEARDRLNEENRAIAARKGNAA